MQVVILEDEEFCAVKSYMLQNDDEYNFYSMRAVAAQSVPTSLTERNEQNPK